MISLGNCSQGNFAGGQVIPSLSPNMRFNLIAGAATSLLAIASASTVLSPGKIFSQLVMFERK